jgi:SPP1 gp7 family putative phage head morphogenesis protein
MMPTPQETLIDLYIDHAINLQRIGTTQWNKLKPIFLKMQKDIIDQLKTIDPTDSPKAAARRKKLNRLFELNQRTIKSYYAELADEQEKFAYDLADYENEFGAATLNKAIGADIGAATLTPLQLEAIASNVVIQGAPSAKWWARQSTELQEKFADQIRMGFAQGESVTDMVRRIQGYPKGVGGIMNVSRRNAEALVRTSVQEIAGTVRENMIEKNEDLIKGYVYSATLDGRTTPQCRARDGKKWNNGKEPVGHKFSYKLPPIHWQCRSSILPWLKSFEELGSKIKIDIPEGTRASMDGQVPASMNYSSWLKTRSPEFQRGVLGETRYQWFKEGRLKLTDLVNQQDRPLTVDELRKKYDLPKTTKEPKIKAVPKPKKSEVKTDIPKPKKAQKEPAFKETTVSVPKKEIETFQIKKKLNDIEKWAVEDYSGDGFMDLNEYLRNPGKVKDSLDVENFENKAKNIRSAIAKSVVNKDTYVARGINSRVFDDMLKSGVSEMPLSGFQSTTTSMKMAQQYAIGGTVMRIKIPKGSNAAYLNKLGLARNVNESEVLLPDSGKYVIKGYSEKEDGRMYIDVEYKAGD